MLSQVSTAVVLAGGLGTRLRSVVSDVPKPMAPVRGRPFLEHLLAHWAGKGIEKFVLSVGYRHDIIVNHFGNNFRGASIEYVIEDMPMGTGGGLLLCMPHLPETFMLLNGDTFFDVDIQSLMRIHETQRSDWTFSLFKSDNSDRYMAVDVGENGLIAKLGCKPCNPLFHVNGGVYMVSRRILACMDTPKEPLSLENDLMPRLLKNGARMAALDQNKLFIDIGIPSDYLCAGDVLPR